LVVNWQVFIINNILINARHFLIQMPVINSGALHAASEDAQVFLVEEGVVRPIVTGWWT